VTVRLGPVQNGIEISSELGGRMLCRLAIVLAILLLPTLAHTRGVEPQLVAEGPDGKLHTVKTTTVATHRA
jgi:hypothetical protein